MLDTIGKNLISSQKRELKKFGGRINKLGVNFAVCDVNNEPILLCESDNFRSDREQLIKSSREALRQHDNQNRADTESNVWRSGEHNQVLAVVLNFGSEPVGVGLIDLGDDSPCMKGDANQGEGAQYDIRDTIFSEMLAILSEDFHAAAKAEEQIEMVSTELAQTYEELVLLHKLSTNMRVTEPDANFLQMACDSLTDIVSVEGIAILLEKPIEGEKQLVLAAGSGLIDINEQMASTLKNRLTEEINTGKEALLDSEVDSPFRYDWPDNIKNIIAVPLWCKDEMGAHFSGDPILQKKNKMGTVEKTQNGNFIIGLMVAINRVDKQDFDSTDVKLFNSVANGCAVFIDNGRLFKDLKELFIGSLRALTSSIDAKDQYTRGHSERVAFISRWIAERYGEQEPLKEEEIHKIYLAGLLHDVGKMGVDESVLRKEGRLSEDELNHIRMHPLIGASILGEIKQMRDIVPGVLSHHERADGKGYPNGLTGKEIPLVGKIVGLADSFDAMISKRTYRSAMTIEEALAEIDKNLGTQFDEKVGRVFINSDVYQLWEIMQEGFTEIYGTSHSVEYGAVAVGSIIR
ncbi:MAG: HD domain-containing phosphohydrolase [Planctomycetota bacterium]|jgi:HD-GYP domain-containing protein (c-di-GMP phosphodiesterase class II)